MTVSTEPLASKHLGERKLAIYLNAEARLPAAITFIFATFVTGLYIRNNGVLGAWTFDEIGLALCLWALTVGLTFLTLREPVISLSVDDDGLVVREHWLRRTWVSRLPSEPENWPRVKKFEDADHNVYHRIEVVTFDGRTLVIGRRLTLKSAEAFISRMDLNVNRG